MKPRLRFVLAALLVAALFTGCDLLDKADDVKFDTVVEVGWVADENLEGTNVPYFHSETVDLTSDPGIAKYANKIKDVKINKITYYITNYNAEPHNSAVTFNSGVASFVAIGATVPTVSVPYGASASGVNLQTTTSETELNIDADGLNQLAAVFKQDKKMEFESEGTLSVIPVSFNVVSKFYVTITANALD